MLRGFSINVIDNIIDKIIPKEINPISGLSNLGKIPGYIAHAKLGAYILFGLLAAILITLIILIFKKRK